MSHSPTPWYVVESLGGALSVRNIASVLASHHHPWRYDGQDERYEQEVREYRGNFALIAAAPELLAALQEYIDAREASFPSAAGGKDAQDAWSDRIDKALIRARDALAMARGEV